MLLCHFWEVVPFGFESWLDVCAIGNLLLLDDFLSFQQSFKVFGLFEAQSPSHCQCWDKRREPEQLLPALVVQTFKHSPENSRIHKRQRISSEQPPRNNLTLKRASSNEAAEDL